jgi:hypothetical protein
MIASMDVSFSELPSEPPESDSLSPPIEHFTYSAGISGSRLNGKQYRRLRLENLRRFQLWTSRFAESTGH